MKKMKLKVAAFTLLFCLGFVTIACGQANREKKERKEPPTFTQLIKDLDANEDGKLSKAEIKGPLKEDFDKVDSNEDGYISKEEFEKAPKPKRRKPQGRN